MQRKLGKSGQGGAVVEMAAHPHQPFEHGLVDAANGQDMGVVVVCSVSNGFDLHFAAADKFYPVVQHFFEPVRTQPVNQRFSLFQVFFARLARIGGQGKRNDLAPYVLLFRWQHGKLGICISGKLVVLGGKAGFGETA